MGAERLAERWRGAAGRLLAWLVTGPLGRGAAFAVDFAAALRVALAARRSSRPRGGGG